MRAKGAARSSIARAAVKSPSAHSRESSRASMRSGQAAAQNALCSCTHRLSRAASSSFVYSCFVR